MKTLKNIWAWIVNWFEYGDLVPLLVIISAFHYAAILEDKDALPVAISLGLLVDLGHFRTIRAAFRYDGDNLRHRVGLWLIALVMTGVSFAYHERYYQDFWLSAPIPFLIAALAWLQKVDRRAGKVAEASSKHIHASKKVIHASSMHICKKCGEEFASIPALATHARWSHAPERVNGKTSP